jgi:hypothetical protein
MRLARERSMNGSGYFFAYWAEPFMSRLPSGCPVIVIY